MYQTTFFGAYTHKPEPQKPDCRFRLNGGLPRLRPAPAHRRRLELPTVKAYTREKFQQLIDKIEATPGYTEAQIDLFIGRLYANCVEAIINAQGKLLIPKQMCEHAQLSSSVRARRSERIFRIMGTFSL